MRFFDCSGLNFLYFNQINSNSSNQLPGSVSYIGDNAFNGCSQLYGIDISNCQIDSISSSMFAGCSSLETITIPYGVEIIGDYAFSGTALEDIIIPSAVESIGNYAFGDCEDLQYIEILAGTSLSNIGVGAFKNSALHEFVFPDAVTAIKSYLFAGCGNLTNVSLPINLVSIDSHAFNGTSIASINIPFTVIAIGAWAFGNCPYLNTIEFDYSESQLLTINIYAFCNSGLKSICIPESVQSIGEYAFMLCDNLANITFLRAKIEGEQDITAIHTDAFLSCDNLISIFAPDELSAAAYRIEIPSVANKIKGYTTGLSYELLQDGTYAVSKGTCDIVGELVIPKMYNYILVTQMAASAFSGCVDITSVIIPDTITRINSLAFSGCGLNNVVIPESVTHIGWGAFNCLNLTTVELKRPSSMGVTQIDGAFTDKVLCVIVPDEATEGDYWQPALSWLKERMITVSQELEFTLMANSTYSVAKKENAQISGTLTIPSYYNGKAVSEIADGAFMNCYDLKNVIIYSDSKMTRIGDCAFKNCGLNEICIPDSVTTIGDEAFYFCTDLINVYLPDNVSEINDTTFYGCVSLENVVVSNEQIKQRYMGSLSEYDISYPFECVTQGLEYRYDLINHTYSVSKGTSNITGKLIYYPYYEGRPVTVIDDFSDCDGITSVVISVVTTYISSSAFADCDSLEYIVIRDNISTVGVYAFSGCDSLAIVALMKPYSVGSNIPITAFEGCINLEGVMVFDEISYNLYYEYFETSFENYDDEDVIIDVAELLFYIMYM